MKMVILSFIVLGVFLTRPAGAVVWQEPTCDPTDPASISTCNVAVPLNVSSSAQTKAGSLTVQNGFQLTGGGLVLPNDSVTEAMVRDDITAGQFKYDLFGTPAVDLATEVAGTLLASSLPDDWVDEIGDNMTGTLTIQSPSSTGLVIQNNGTSTSTRGIEINGTGVGSYLFINQQGTGAEAITISMNNSVTGRGIAISNSSTSSGSIPLDINNGSSPSTRAVNIQTQATAGYGLYSVSSGTSSTGVFGFGTAYGLQGSSSAGTGVRGDTTSGTTNNYGVIGCKNSGNCGSLGGTTWAGYFEYDTATQGQVIGDRFLPTKPETFGYTSYIPGTIMSSLTSILNPWADVEYVGSSGGEIWVFNNHSSGNPGISRIEASTGKRIAEKSFGVYPAYAATLTSKGLIFISSVGDTYGWFNDTEAPALITNAGAGSKSNMNRLLYDGTYLWGGRSGGLGIDRFNASNYAGDVLTTFGGGTGVGGWGTITDFEQDEQYIYALSDANTADPNSDGKIMRINPNTNQVDKEIIFKNTQLERLLFDGRYLWVTVSTPIEAVYQIDLKNNSGGLTFSTLNFGASYGSFSDPFDMVFDGSFIWVSLRGSNTVARFSPNQDPTAPQIFQSEFMTTSAGLPEHLVFDGQSVWATHGGNSGPNQNPLLKLASGKGYGYQTSPIARGGVSSYDAVTNAATCMRVESGVVVVISGSFCP